MSYSRHVSGPNVLCLSLLVTLLHLSTSALRRGRHRLLAVHVVSLLFLYERLVSIQSTALAAQQCPLSPLSLTMIGCIFTLGGRSVLIATQLLFGICVGFHFHLLTLFWLPSLLRSKHCHRVYLTQTIWETGPFLSTLAHRDSDYFWHVFLTTSASLASPHTRCAAP